MKLELSSGTIDYLDQGTGPPVLLIHAFPLSNAMWAPQFNALSNQFRLIAPNVRGFGDSRTRAQWTMEDMADDLHELLDRLGVPSCAVVGVSMGGYIALTLWSRHPARVGQIVLSNSRARADNDLEKTARNEMIAALEQSGAGILPDRMLPRLLQPNPKPDVLREVRRMIEQADSSAAAYAVMAMRERMDFSTMLHRMECPAMVIAGENDLIIRMEDSRSIADTIPGAKFAAIPASGHLSNLENPEAFNAELVSFLDSK